MKEDLLERMEREMPTFSKGQRQIATYIIHHYEKSAYMTASKLGAAVNVSESTVVRFAIELGFAGYPEFQRAMQNIIRNRLKSFQRIEVTNHLIGGGDVLEKVLTSDVDKIKHTLDTIDREAFERCAKLTIINESNQPLQAEPLGVAEVKNEMAPKSKLD